nr:MAG TPA: hypothetical protein [Caudoviricetes sp.]
MICRGSYFLNLVSTALIRRVQTFKCTLESLISSLLAPSFLLSAPKVHHVS